MMLPLFILLILFCGNSYGHNIGLIASFGDYNNDRLTDVISITDNGTSFEIFLQKINKTNPFIRSNEHKCSLHNGSKETIISLIPSDFTGNTMLDILVITVTPSSHDKIYHLRLLNPNGTSLDCSPLLREPFANVSSQPLLLDFNGDMRSDILVFKDGSLYVYLGTNNSLFTEELIFQGSAQNFTHSEMQVFQSSAFVDMNHDKVSDIVLASKYNIQYILASDTGYNTVIYKNYPINSNDIQIGQSSFGDINSDTLIEHILSVCDSKGCKIYVSNSYNSSKWICILDEIKIDNTIYIFTDINKGNILLPMTLRVGDFNMDGYPDLVAIMRPKDKKNSKNNSVIFFENIVSTNEFGRSFKPSFINIENKNLNPYLVTFFDLYEDGKLDILINAGPLHNAEKLETDSLELIEYSNTKELDSNFLKVLISSGLCTDKLCFHNDYYILEKYRVPYGTNKAGPSVCYQFLDAKGHNKRSCSIQLSQSANFALQMPYILFGLDQYANYIDQIVITIPTGNTNVIYTRTEVQIVPDSQIVVIPNPIENPAKWKVRFYLNPSDFITKTLYTFGTICIVLVILIIILHRREMREDEPEKQLFKGFWVD